MIADYHVHTPYCGHAHGTTIEYVEAAISSGIHELGFSDHLGRYYLTRAQKRRHWDWGMGERDLARYFSEILDLKEAFADRISIRIGLEADYVEGAEDLLEPLLSRYPFDFCLGSIHCLPRFGWKHMADYKSGFDVRDVYREYFSVCRSALKSGLFSALAHPDFIWRHIPWPVERTAEIVDDLSQTVHCAVVSKVPLEANANGYLWALANSAPESNPFELLFEIVARSQATVSLGSDAHEPSGVAKAFPGMIELLLRKGIRNFTRFSAKQAAAEPIDRADAFSLL